MVVIKEINFSKIHVCIEFQIITVLPSQKSAIFGAKFLVFFGKSCNVGFNFGCKGTGRLCQNAAQAEKYFFMPSK
jgi:hypothetical protein